MSRDTWFDKAVLLASRPDASQVELALALAPGKAKGARGKLKRFSEKSKISLRKVYYLAEVGKKLKNLRISKARLERIGWTKLHIIAKHMTKEDAGQLLVLAEAHNCHQLKAMMPEWKTKSKSETNTRCILMYFSPDQYQEFEKAILSHDGKRSGRGLINKEEAILNIIASIPKASRTASSP